MEKPRLKGSEGSYRCALWYTAVTIRKLRNDKCITAADVTEILLIRFEI